MVKQTKTVYSSDSIVNETPREFTRRVPSTYLGSSITNENLIKEIYANAVDEAKIGHGDLIRVSIDTVKNVYCVEDFGQGFLINEPGVDKKTGKKIDDGETILQRSFDKINTSGKTSVDGVYGGNSLGLNGIGAKLTNWLSSTLHVITYRDGRFEELWFKDGIFVKRKVGKSDRHSGTIVTWSPDPQFFKQNIPNMSMIDALLDHTTTFCAGLTVELEYNGSKKTFKEPDGLNGYLARKVGEKEVFSQRFITDRSISVNDYAYEYGGQTIFLLDSDFNSKGICEQEFTLYEETPQGGQIQHKETLTIAKSDCAVKEREENINIGITFTRDHSETIDAYVNLGYTESGAHITAFHGAIARAINKYAVEAGLLKKSDKSLSSSEVCDGLYVVFNITTTTAKYDAQNKSHIDDIDTTIINSVLSGDFATWLLNNKADAKAIVENALIERKARENAQKARDKTREVANGKGAKSIFADLPTKLSDAYPRNKKDRSNCELFICLKGDTKVKLLDGTSPTIESLVGKQDIWAYSTDESGTMIPAKIKKVFKTQETSKLIKLTFNDDSIVECTPEHKFLDRDTCQWVEAKDLVVGQSMLGVKLKVEDSINLQVTSIEYVTYEQPIPVYCLNIDNPFHSFVLDNGIITHNCEGDSAGSSIKGVKNSEFQAVMPIRGKILNCLKEKDIAKIYGNAEVAGIVKALGLDVDPKTHRLIFNEAKLRYSKIIIATDADADGSDISSLLLTVFDFLCPELIEKGYIYRVYGALFKAIFNDNTYVLLQNDADLEAWKKKNKKPYTLTRAKGLGELTAEETEEQLVNPMTRNLKRLKVDNYDEFKKYLLIYKGDAKEDKEARKEYYNKLVGGND